MLSSVFLPARDPQSRRLLVVLHGLGDSVDGWRWLPHELDQPWLNYLLVNAPDDYFGGFSWFGIRLPLPGAAPRREVLPEILAADVVRSRRLLHELLDAQAAAGFASADTALLGFSQGCLMALDAGLRYRQPLAGLIGISGWVHDPAALAAEAPPHARTVPVLATHGRQDPVVPYEPAAAQARQLQTAGFDLVWTEFDKEHTVAGRAEIEHLRRFLEGVFHQPRRSGRSAGGE